MLTHIVCIRFDTAEHAAEAVDRLRAMAGRVPTLRAIEAGLDITRSPRSLDLALITRHADQAGLDAYRVHPLHLEVLDFIREHAEASYAVDYLADPGSAAD
ncbi:MAG: Dabb family protein [Myxococcales bacterium]|nr:Dabb family protein [Myxococcales bacterium]